MKIEHIAIWSEDIERLKTFYVKYFNAESNEKYKNDDKDFESYFLTFDQGARLELMKKPGLVSHDRFYTGFAHLAMSVGTIFNVMKLTQKIKDDGYKVISEPRQTGDGYFESLVLDPDGNRVEITR